MILSPSRRDSGSSVDLIRASVGRRKTSMRSITNSNACPGPPSQPRFRFDASGAGG
jgi:hypothetical protein